MTTNANAISAGGVAEAGNGGSSQDSPLPRGLSLLLTTAAIIITTGGLKLMSSLMGPVFAGLVLVIAVYPLRAKLLRKGAPAWVAAVSVPLAAFGILIALAIILIFCIVTFVDYVSSADYGARIGKLRDDATEWLNELGIEDEQLSSALDGIDIGAVAGRLASSFAGLFGVLGTVATIFMVIAFVATDSGSFVHRLEKEVAAQRPRVAKSLLTFAGSTRTYFVVNSIFGLIAAVADTLVLLWLDIPLALVWGVLSFLSSFIPNVGFIIGLFPPALLGLAEDGLNTALIVVVAYIVINFMSDSVIKPRFVGDAVGLSTTLTFVSLIFWSWVFGPLGSLLAVPLTLFARALLIDSDPTADWLAPLIAGDSSDDVDVDVDADGSASEKEPSAEASARS